MNNLDIDNILGRLKEVAGIKKDKEIAPLLSLSPQSFSNRKKRGTLIPLIMEWAARNGINGTWILTGTGTARSLAENLTAETPVQKAVRQHLEQFGDKGAELTEAERRVIAMLRRIDPEMRQHLVNAITNAYFEEIEKEEFSGR